MILFTRNGGDQDKSPSLSIPSPINPIMHSTAAKTSSPSTLPSGYVAKQTADGTTFAVPQFLIPATELAFDYHKEKDTAQVATLSAVVTILYLRYILFTHVPTKPHQTHGFDGPYINAGTVMAPVDPVSIFHIYF